MKYSCTIVAISLLLCFTAGAQVHRRVLFLGNSYTYYNNMPQMVAGMAGATGDTLVFDMYAPGGYTIDDHSADVVSQNKIMGGNWDYVSIQEQSQLPGAPGYFSNGLYGLASLFKTYNPCGRIMFYMTWGRKNGDPLNCPSFPNMCTYLGMDTQIRENYTMMAQNYECELSPVGAAWRYVRQHNPGINLYEPDDSHPTLAGSYLAACCFYTAIFKKDPLLISYNSVLSATDAAQLRQAARYVVFDSLAYWDHSPGAPVADFTYSIGSGINQVNCFNHSSSFTDSYLWDFGDGYTSTQTHPTHSYAADGTYTITLTAFNCDLDTTYQSTYQRTVTFCPFTPTIVPATLTVCPGIADTLWTQPGDAYQWYDESGNPIPNAVNQYIVCTAGNTYSVSVTQNGCSELSVPVPVFAYGNLNVWFLQAAGNLVGTDTVCIGDSLVLSMWFNKPPFPNDTLIDWYVDGQQITGYHNDSLVIKTSGTYAARLRHPFCSTLNQTRQEVYTFIPCPTYIAEPNERPAVVLYPNPGDGHFIIETSEELDMTVQDVLGKVILRQHAAAGKHLVDISAQAAGIYFVHMHSPGHSYSCRLVKQ